MDHDNDTSKASQAKADQVSCHTHLGALPDEIKDAIFELIDTSECYSFLFMCQTHDSARRAMVVGTMTFKVYDTACMNLVKVYTVLESHLEWAQRRHVLRLVAKPRRKANPSPLS